jgi:hypothetical protein
MCLRLVNGKRFGINHEIAMVLFQDAYPRAHLASLDGVSFGVGAEPALLTAT